MADIREPPPLFEEELDSKDLENDDIFASDRKEKSSAPIEHAEKQDPSKFEDVTAEVILESPAAEKRSKSNTPEVEPDEDLFKPEPLPSKNDSTGAKHSDAPPRPIATQVPFADVRIGEDVEDRKAGVFKSTTHDEAPKMTVSESSTAYASANKPPFGFHAVNKKEQTNSEVPEAESKYSIDITIVDTKKVGDGMNAFVVYKICTNTTIPDFRHSEMEVFRRFSDFLGLRDKLAEKHLHQGVIIPLAPEKSVIGMAKIKVSKEESGPMEFVEQRRAALERFLNRVAQHPTLQTDPNFVDFLELDGDLPKSTSTSALSGAGVLRLFSRVGDSIGKITYKMDETDQWFEEKTQQVETLDAQLRKLQSNLEVLVSSRRELAQSTGIVAKSIALLGSSEEHSSLSRCLSQLAEVEERLDKVQEEQADSDFFIFAEFVKDYVGILQSVKDVFHERVKLYKIWKDNEVALAKKREAKVRMELAHKMDKIQEASREISEWEQHVEKSQQDFERISKNIHKEMKRFEHQRCKDFRRIVIAYLESLLNHEQQIIKHWETFLPEAKIIA